MAQGWVCARRLSGSRRLGSAQRLRLYPGQELLDVDFALATSRLFVIAGRAVDVGGPPVAGLALLIHPMEPSGLPGGEHKVTVGREGGSRFPRRGPGPLHGRCVDPRRTMRWVSSMKMLTVDGDVRDLELRAELGATIEGHLVRDVGATRTLDMASVYVGFTTQVDGQVGGFTGSDSRRVPTERFHWRAPAGSRASASSVCPSGWAVKSVSLDGAELDDVPIDFGSGRRQVEIVLTDKVSIVSGIVVDLTGARSPAIRLGCSARAVAMAPGVEVPGDGALRQRRPVSSRECAARHVPGGGRGGAADGLVAGPIRAAAAAEQRRDDPAG